MLSMHGDFLPQTLHTAKFKTDMDKGHCHHLWPVSSVKWGVATDLKANGFYQSFNDNL